MVIFEKCMHVFLSETCVVLGPCGGAVRWGITLQAGKIQVWFPTVSLYFRFRYDLWFDSTTNRNWYQEYFFEFYIWEFYLNIWRILKIH
jgi:hypothetical protein